MGTRAAFWVGDPANLDSREWLGCIAWDGHPENFKDFTTATTERGWRQRVRNLAAKRNDFVHPARGWPFPWADDIFLTDVTYAFFDGTVHVCWFHKPFQTIVDYFAPRPETNEEEEEEEELDDPRHKKVPAPAAYDRTQPDSIMILRVG